MKNIQSIPFDRLEPSKHHVRRVRAGKPSQRQLVASIRKHGVLQNLVVIPMPGDRSRYGVVAGTRRLAAVATLIKKGELDATVPLRCLVKKADDATAVSLSENFAREALHAADEFDAFERLASDGLSDRDIARHFGITHARVRKLRRLANVAPELLADFRKGDLSLDEIMAFSVTADREQQLACRKALGNGVGPFHIRRHLTEGTVRGDNAKAAFVTLKAYKAAGGGWTADLFNDEVFLTDPALLDRLATEKIESAAAEVAAEGWKWVAAQADYAGYLPYRRLSPETVAVPKRLLDRSESLERRLQEIRATDDWTPATSDRYEALARQQERLKDRFAQYRHFSDEQKQMAGAVLAIRRNGSLAVTRGLVRPEDESTASADGDVTAGAPRTNGANGAISHALRADLNTFRANAMKAELADAAPVATDLLFYTVAMQALRPSQGEVIVCEARCMQPSYALPAPQGRVADKLEAALGSVPMDWSGLGTSRERYEAFCALGQADKAALVALAVSVLLTPQPAGFAPDTTTAALTRQLNLDVARWWRPDADSYFKRIARADLLALGEDLCGSTWAADHAKDKKRDLVEALDALFNDEAVRSGLSDELRARIDAWLPQEIRN